MSSEHPFDWLSKRLATGLSRRTMLVRSLSSLVIGVASGRSREAKAEEQSWDDFKSIYGKPGVTCTGGSRVLIEKASDGAMGNVRPVCLYDTRCSRKGESGPRQFLIGCYAVEGVCPNFEACAKEALGDWPFRLLKASQPEKPARSANLNRFGSTCKYNWATPVALYRKKLDDSEKWDAMCATPVTGCMMPPELKGSFLAVCDGIGFTGEGKDRTLICPTVGDCLGKPISATSNGSAAAR